MNEKYSIEERELEFRKFNLFIWRKIKEIISQINMYCLININDFNNRYKMVLQVYSNLIVGKIENIIYFINKKIKNCE